MTICLHSAVRHQQASQGPWDTTDKFRVDLYQGNRLMGRKHLNAVLTKHDLTPKSNEVRATSFTVGTCCHELSQLSLYQTLRNIAPSLHHKLNNRRSLVSQLYGNAS